MAKFANTGPSAGCLDYIHPIDDPTFESRLVGRKIKVPEVTSTLCAGSRTFLRIATALGSKTRRAARGRSQAVRRRLPSIPGFRLGLTEAAGNQRSSRTRRFIRAPDQRPRPHVRAYRTRKHVRSAGAKASRLPSLRSRMRDRIHLRVSGHLRWERMASRLRHRTHVEPDPVAGAGDLTGAAEWVRSVGLPVLPPCPMVRTARDGTRRPCRQTHSTLSRGRS
jgi:hypothetical protein